MTQTEEKKIQRKLGKQEFARRETMADQVTSRLRLHGDRDLYVDRFREIVLRMQVPEVFAQEGVDFQKHFVRSCCARGLIE